MKRGIISIRSFLPAGYRQRWVKKKEDFLREEVAES